MFLNGRREAERDAEDELLARVNTLTMLAEQQAGRSSGGADDLLMGEYSLA